jgi:hypothetical protein
MAISWHLFKNNKQLGQPIHLVSIIGVSAIYVVSNINPQVCELIEAPAGKPYWRGKLSTVDLLALTSSYQLLLIMQTSFTFYIKQAALMRRSTVMSLTLRWAFPAPATVYSASMVVVSVNSVFKMIFFENSSLQKFLIISLAVAFLAPTHFVSMTFWRTTNNIVKNGEKVWGPGDLSPGPVL